MEAWRAGLWIEMDDSVAVGFARCYTNAGVLAIVIDMRKQEPPSWTKRMKMNPNDFAILWNQYPVVGNA